MQAQPSHEPNAEYFIPSEEWIQSLQEGDFVPDCFGQLNAITRIHARGVDISGRVYICFYTRFSETSTMSGSFKVGELHRTVGISGRHTSHELDQIEKRGV